MYKLLQQARPLIRHYVSVINSLGILCTSLFGPDKLGPPPRFVGGRFEETVRRLYGMCNSRFFLSTIERKAIEARRIHFVGPGITTVAPRFRLIPRPRPGYNRSMVRPQSVLALLSWYAWTASRFPDGVASAALTSARIGSGKAASFASTRRSRSRPRSASSWPCS